MSNPPKKTRTQPGLGEGTSADGVRLGSAELERVRADARVDDEAPRSSLQRPPSAAPADAGRPARARDSVRREDPDEPSALARPAEQVFRPRLRDSVRRDDPDEPPPPSVESVTPRPPRGARDSIRREEPTSADSLAPRPGLRRDSVVGRDMVRRDSVVRREELRVTESVSPRARDSVRRDEREDPVPERPRPRDSVRREDPDDSVTPREEQVALRPSAGPRRPASTSPSPWPAEKETGLRARPTPSRSPRAPVTVDEVGTTAMKIARTTIRQGEAPKLVASRGIVARAPIDTRSAFVLSLVDGRNTVDAIVDMSGMPDDEVRSILDRLSRLGLVQLP